ncbi:MAG: signal peptidase I [Spirochaetaceae bacterium]|jgi:signal peptidase I|nr:signal peptidase I [Spirochaetaceae bacterium]
MFNKWRKYSYAAQKDQYHRLRWVVLLFCAFFLLYLLLSSFVISTRELGNDTMRPGLYRGDRFIFSSRTIFRFLPDSASTLSLGRGEVVLVDEGLRNPRSFPVELLDSVIRFFTAQKLGLGNRLENHYIKRIIGFPGDEISIANYVARVKPSGSAYSLTEFELWERPYDVDIPQTPALWDESLPFSGNMETLLLGEDECFVLSDDRGNTNDSRTWGPLPLDLIAGKALFRYWPLNRLGLP